MDGHGFWGVVRQRIVPALVGIAAVLVAIAAVIYIVDEVRDGRRGDRGSGHAVAAWDVRAPDRTPDMRRGNSWRGGSRGNAFRAEGFTSTGAWSPGPPMLGIAVEQTPEGIRVASVVTGLGAEAAGVEPDDLLLSVGGEPIEDVRALITRLAGYQAGDEVVVGISRDGTEQELRVALAPGAARWRFGSR